jgi:hypothetical protein
MDKEQINDNNKPHYLNLQIEDLSNEIWVDAINGDGKYMVSNLGRIKSLPRKVKTVFNSCYIKQGRIRKQNRTMDKYGNLGNLLIKYNNYSNSVAKIVFCSFNPNVKFIKNEVVIHKNKITTDNTIDNLQKTNWKESKLIDQILSEKTRLLVSNGVFSEMSKKGILVRNMNFSERKSKKCSICKEIKEIEFFKRKDRVCILCDKIKNRERLSIIRANWFNNNYKIGSYILFKESNKDDFIKRKIRSFAFVDIDGFSKIKFEDCSKTYILYRNFVKNFH